MFKHCLSKFSCTLVVMCALVTGGLFQSCVEDPFDLDEYKYDDSEPSWLGPSIYEFLKTGNAGHTYTNYVKLIEDLDQKEILSRTGSRTMFIADDAAFERFYQSNSWGVQSYDDFTYRQKRVLLFNVMLKNAYLLDMLAATVVDPKTEQMGGDCLRRETMATLYDSVPLFSVDSEVKGLRFPENNGSFKLFEEYLTNSGKSNIRVAIGNANPMMVHFLYEYVRTQNIQDEDFAIMFQRAGKTRTGTEAFIFDNKILTSDVSYGDLSDDTLTITCKNGYLYRMDDVLIPPSNMAQVLRETENTRLFSRILDRFAYLEYSKSYSEAYNDIYHEGKPEENENIYLLKYALKAADGASYGQAYYSPDESGYTGDSYPKSLKSYFGKEEYVKYDPGNAQYKSSNGIQEDMAALLVPNDTMIYRFFTPERLQDPTVIEANYITENGKRVQARPYGVGASIIEQYAASEDIANLQEVPGLDYADVMSHCLDSVPMKILSAFICNLMQESFLQTLPSNFERVRNDARDDMGLKKTDVSDCILANNGIIYILNNVYGPAKYQAVMTPPLVMTNMRIMNAIIDGLHYDSYLLAMDSKFSFIVPDDSCFVYYDPTTMKTTEPMVYIFGYGKAKPTDKQDALIATVCTYDRETYQITDTVVPSAQAGVSSFKNAFQDLMEYFIIVDEVEETENEYFLTKGYGIVKCIKDADGSVKFQGGQQLELSKELGHDVYVTIKDNGRYQEKNGVTYCTESKDENYKSGVVSPPTRTIFSYLSEATSENPFYEFYQLCTALEDVETYLKIFNLTDSEEDAPALEDTLAKYRIFSDFISNMYYSYDQAVPFFSTYHYTVYVPQASALEEAYALGLPQYDDIKAEVDAENYGRATSMIRMLNKFVRYHFQDNAVMVDKRPFQVKVGESYVDEIRYETSTIDDATGRFFDLLVKTEDNTIAVTDGLDRTAKVMKDGEEGKTWNVLTRDILFTRDPESEIGGGSIGTSSYAVVHKIDKALYNSGVIGYDGRFRRFAKDGELVDTIHVNQVPVSYDEANNTTEYGKKEYIIGKSHSYFIKASGKFMDTGYLMKPIDTDSKFVKEDYILLGDTAKILMTEDAKLVGIDTLESGELSLRYLWADLKPLSVDESGVVIDPDSVVSVLPDGTLVDVKGKAIKK